MENRRFKTMSAREREDHFARVLRIKTDDLLTPAEVGNIVSSLEDTQCSILFTQDERLFGERLALSHVRTDKEHGMEEHIERGQKIFGRFSFGERNVTTDIDGTRSQRTDADFDTDVPAAALIRITNIGFRDLSVIDSANLLMIYVPEGTRSSAENASAEIPDARNIMERIPA